MASENKDSKHILHERNKFFPLLGSGAGMASGITNKFNKEGRRRAYLISKDKNDKLSLEEQKELRKLNHLRARGVIGTTIGGMAGTMIGAGAGMVGGMKPGAALAGGIGGAVLGNHLAKRGPRKRSIDSYSDQDTMDEFIEFYSENSDKYNDTTEGLNDAYQDFLDNYSVLSSVGSSIAKGASKVGSTIAKGAAKAGRATMNTLGSATRSAVTGATIGAGVNALRGKSMTTGALGGAAVGVGASQIAKRFSHNDNNTTMNLDRTYSEEDLFDAFSEYYNERTDLYGDTEEGMDLAYNDFLGLLQEAESNDQYNDEDNFEVAEGFEDYLMEVGDQYADTEEGISDAYNDYLSLISQGSEEDSEYADTEEDNEEHYNQFADYYSETYSMYDSIDDAYNDFLQFEQEDEFAFFRPSMKNKGKTLLTGMKKESPLTRLKNKLANGARSAYKGLQEAGAAAARARDGYSDEYEDANDQFNEDLELSFDQFSDGFAEYYADNEELYGESEEDLEEAYDDYSDLVADENLDLMYSSMYEVEDNEYSVKDKLTGLAKTRTAKGAAIGAAAGLAGGIIAGSVGKDAKERRELKAKIKAGTATESEKTRYNELIAKRRNKIILSMGAGTVAGAGAGAASKKAHLALPAKKDTENSAADENKTANIAEDKLFSSVSSLIGAPGATESKSFLGNTNASKSGSMVLDLIK